MFKQNFFLYGGQILLKKIAEIAFFPIWWYSRGLKEFALKIFRFYLDREKSLGWSIWVKNILVPMYGQTDWAGRIISFFVRLVQIIVRSLALLTWFIILFSLLIAWLLLPIFLLIALFFQIMS